MFKANFRIKAFCREEFKIAIKKNNPAKFKIFSV